MPWLGLGWPMAFDYFGGALVVLSVLSLFVSPLFYVLYVCVLFSLSLLSCFMFLFLVGTDVNLSWYCCLSYLMWLGTSIPIEGQADH